MHPGCSRHLDAWELLPSTLTINGLALVSSCYMYHTCIGATGCRGEESTCLSWSYKAEQMPLAQG